MSLAPASGAAASGAGSAAKAPSPVACAAEAHVRYRRPGFRPLLPEHESELASVLARSGLPHLDEIEDFSNGIALFRRLPASAGVLVLIQRARGAAVTHWGIPKGHPEDGESDLQGAIRETLEEVGVAVEEGMVIGGAASSHDERYSFVTKLHKDRWAMHVEFPDAAKRPIVVAHKRVRFFAALIPEDRAALTLQAEEVAEALWLPVAEAQARLCMGAVGPGLLRGILSIPAVRKEFEKDGLPPI